MNKSSIKTGLSATLMLLLALALLTGCKSKQNQQNGSEMKVEQKIVAQFEGKDVTEYSLTNSSGMEVRLISYGAIVTHLTAPSRTGVYEDVVLGFDEAEKYWTEPYRSNVCYLGAIVGRYGNRIGGGKFTLNGKDYSLAVNNGPNSLHGGLVGFDKVVWENEAVRTEEGVGVRFSYLSRDGEEGYPGNFTIAVTYLLKDDNSLLIEYEGSIDQPCPVNVTHHGYFNLSGEARRDILGHQMMIKADRYTVVDETLIPTGELRPVVGTVMDFNTPYAIGERIGQVEGGYDHNYVLSDGVTQLRQVVRVYEPESGRVMEVFTTEPGVQFYSGNFLDGILTGKGGVSYQKHWGFCLETQHFPDSPNQPAFPSTVLEPGSVYRQTTVYRFSAE